MHKLTLTGTSGIVVHCVVASEVGAKELCGLPAPCSRSEPPDASRVTSFSVSSTSWQVDQ
jgi:hypothetical protein